MIYVKPLIAVTQNELQAVGYRCQDLAFLRQQQLQMPSSFVILSNAMEEVVRQNNLKYKIDYILSHAQVEIQSSLQNTYSGARKAMLEAKFPHGLETELKEFYDSITAPLAIGELTTERPPVRIIMSTNRIDDPESNDMVIQNVGSFDELLTGVREAWALAYHPSLLGARMRERFPEARFKVALIVQSMEEPTCSIHAYSSLPQDHTKVYLQVYYGYPDLRERVVRDYYAISKETLRIVASQLRQQPSALQRVEKELTLVPLAPRPGDKMIDRDLVETARLAKKIERLLGKPVKIFFSIANETIEVLWANRLGFDIIIGQENAGNEQAVQEAKPEPRQESTHIEPAQTVVVPDQSDFIVEKTEEKTAEAKPIAGVAAKLLGASLRIVHQIVERKYRSAFGETDIMGNLAEMINRLNGASAFSRPVDGALLLQAEEAAKRESNISEAEYAKAIEEVAFLMNYA